MWLLQKKKRSIVNIKFIRVFHSKPGIAETKKDGLLELLTKGYILKVSSQN